MSTGLKLSAIETEDVTVLSAAMEGAITSPGEIGYSKTGRSFSLTASRFKWEKFNAANKTSERVRSGLYVGDVLSVKATGISQEIPTMATELLSISCIAGEDASADIMLNFAGGGTIRLAVECINVTLTDVGDAWTVEHIPFHTDNVK